MNQEEGGSNDKDSDSDNGNKEEVKQQEMVHKKELFMLKFIPAKGNKTKTLKEMQKLGG